MAAHRHHVVVGHDETTTSQQPRASAVAAVADTYGSSSTLSAETAAGWHVLTVEDYSQTKQLSAATGWPIPSSTFTAGGCTWRLRFKCSPEPPASWICFMLYLEPPGGGADLDDGAMVRTRYSLLLDHHQAGGGQPPLPSSSTSRVVVDSSARTLSSMLRSWTCTRFMERERFESSSSSYVKDNRFSVRCDVAVVTTACRPSGAMPPPDLRRHLLDLLATGVGADVTLEVGAEAFPAHRSVLAARSPVFRAELFGGLGLPHREGDVDAAATTTTTRVMRIHDVVPSVFKALLHFIYTDSLPGDENEIDDGAGDKTAMARRRQLLVAAQRYELEGLKWICEDVQLPSLGDQMRAKFGGCTL